MTSYLNWAYRLGCANCAGCIIVGAAGGHKPWPSERKDIFHRGIMYHFMSGVGMILSALQPQACKGLIMKQLLTIDTATVLFQTAIVLFSGSLYHRAFTGSKSLSSIFPPFGGIAMTIAWLFLAFKK